MYYLRSSNSAARTRCEPHQLPKGKRYIVCRQPFSRLQGFYQVFRNSFASELLFTPGQVVSAMRKPPARRREAQA